MHPFAKKFHEIMTDSDLTAVDKMVVAVLWFHCGKNGHCFPSISTLSTEVGADRKTIISSLKKLLSKNRVEIVKTNGKSNRYCLVTSPNSGTTTSPKRGIGSSPKNGTGTHTESGTGLPQNQSQNGTTTQFLPVPKTGHEKN